MSGAQATNDDCDDDWMDLEKVSTSTTIKPDVTVSLGPPNGRHPLRPGSVPRVRAGIVLRRDAAEWIVRNGPRFRVQVGGKACNMIRVVADARGGQFEAATLKGVMRLSIGVVNVWPNEIRKEVAASWKATEGGARPHSAGGIHARGTGTGAGRSACVVRRRDAARADRQADRFIRAAVVARRRTASVAHARRAAARAQRARSAQGGA